MVCTRLSAVRFPLVWCRSVGTALWVEFFPRSAVCCHSVFDAAACPHLLLLWLWIVLDFTLIQRPSSRVIKLPVVVVVDPDPRPTENRRMVEVEENTRTSRQQ